MNDRFITLQLFTRVARTGSFSVAGREMGMSQPSASRIISALEEQVGVALLTRTTRGVVLTEAGTEYLARVDDILKALEEADFQARGTGELRGVLRVATSPSFAAKTILPRLSSFSELHPKLRLNFVLDDQRHDLIGESVDVAIRIGALTDSTAVARKIGQAHRVLVASPAYLDRAGTPSQPAELVAHSTIVGPAGRGSEGWVFRRDGERLSVRVEGRFVLDSNAAATAAAASGLGILSSGDLGILSELANGDLVRVLPDWGMESADINVILPAGRAAKPSAKAFMEFIVTEFRGLENRRVGEALSR